MPSSTSPSSRGWPCQAFALLLLALVALGAAALYTVRWNPEVCFYRHAIDVKRAWSARLAAAPAPAPRHLLAGGSSAAFSVDGERMLDRHGVRLVNFGLHAGMEAPFLLAIAAREARPGDTLIVAMEPELLTTPFTAPDLAAQMGLALGEPRLIAASDLTGAPVPWVDSLVAMRPGAYHAFTLLGKVLLRKPLYRYAAPEIHASGWQEARDFREFALIQPGAPGLSADGRALLAALVRWAEAREVRVCYALPWACVEPAVLEEFRRTSASFLRDVAALLPVLKDPALGVHAVREHFSDTGWHLTPAGAQVRTDALAAQLAAGEFWSLAELDAWKNGRERSDTR
jgi:hypothetical protein